MKRQDSTARIFNPRCCNVRTHSRWTPGSPGPPSQEGRHSAGKDVRRYVMRMPPGSTYSGHKCREKTIRRCKESALNSALPPRLFKLNYGNGSGSKSQENRSDRTGMPSAPLRRSEPAARAVRPEERHSGPGLQKSARDRVSYELPGLQCCPESITARPNLDRPRPQCRSCRRCAPGHPPWRTRS
jgi:hypothetical protein